MVLPIGDDNSDRRTPPYVNYVLIAIEWYWLFAIFIPVYAFLILPILTALSAETTRFLERCAAVQWAVMICIYCISHVPALLTVVALSCCSRPGDCNFNFTDPGRGE